MSRKAEELNAQIEPIEKYKEKEKERLDTYSDATPPPSSRRLGFLTPPSDNNHQFDDVELDESDSRKKLQYEHEVKKLLKERLPSGLIFGIAENNNDRFFDAVAKPLGLLLNAEVTVKSLRLLCDEFVKNEKKKPLWLEEEFAKRFKVNRWKEKRDYLARIMFSVAEMADKNTTRTLIGEAISGDELEARIICNTFKIAIHWIEITDNNQVIEKLTTAENGTVILKKGLEKEQYHNELKMLHLVKSKSHIVPLTRQSKLTQKNESSLLSANNSPNTNHDNVSTPLANSARRNSVIMDATSSVKIFHELVTTEYGYFERLKRFALPEIEGKKVIKEKTRLERFLIWIGYQDEEEEVNNNKVDGGWLRIKKMAEQYKILSQEELETLCAFISTYTLLAKESHAFPLADAASYKKQLARNHLQIDESSAVAKFLSPEYENLLKQTPTAENLPKWINVIYHSVCNNEIYPVFLKSIIPKMFVVAAGQQNEKIKALISKLSNGLKENVTNLSADEHIFFGGQGPAGYLESCLIEPIQRVAKYPLLFREMKKEISNPVEKEIENSIRAELTANFQLSYPTKSEQEIKDLVGPELVKRKEEIEQRVEEALKFNEVYQQLKQIHSVVSKACDDNNRKMRDINESNAALRNMTELFKTIDRNYSVIGLSPQVVSFMSKLSTLIHYWLYDDLGEKIYNEHIEKINNTILYLNYEIDNKIVDETTNRQLIEKENQKRRFLRAIRREIQSQENSEKKYVIELLNLLHLLFIDGNNPNYGQPLKSKLYEKIEEIITNINNPNSIFCNSLKDLLEQDRKANSEVNAKGIIHDKVDSHSTVPLRVRSTYAQHCLPVDIYANNFIKCENPPVAPETPFKHHSTYNSIKSAHAAKKSSVSVLDENQKLLDSHFIRLSIINQVKAYFAQFDAKLQNMFLYKIAGDGVQHISYKVQQELDTLLRYTPEQLDNLPYEPVENGGLGISKTSSRKELVSELIIKRISKHLVVAGDINNNLLTGAFGTTLNQVKDYLNSIANTDNKKNSLHEMFVSTPTYIRKRSAQALSSSYSRKWHEKRYALIANMMHMVDYYFATGLGVLLAKRAELPVNKQIRHAKQIKKLAIFAQKMALDPRGDDQSEQVVNEILGGLKMLLQDYPNEASRSYNELVHLHNNFAKLEDNLQAKDERRFDKKDNKKHLIFEYKINETDAKDYIKLHLVQQCARPFMNYSAAANGRIVVETAVCKESSNAAILSVFDKYYKMSLQEIVSNYNQLPETHRNIVSLMHKEVHEIVATQLSHSGIYQQGLTGQAINLSDELFEDIHPPLRQYDHHVSGTVGRLRRENPANEDESDRVRLLSQKEEEQSVKVISPLTTIKAQLSDSFNFPELVEDDQNSPINNAEKESLLCLLAKVFALSHYYLNSEIGKTICSKLSIQSNMKQGQAAIAKQLASVALEIFLEDESDTEQAIHRRNNNEKTRKDKLYDQIVKMRDAIRGDDSFLANIIQSPDSRLAKALDELLPKSKQRMREVNQKTKLSFTLQQNNDLFKKSNFSKLFIHRAIIWDSCSQFINMEKDLNGRIRKIAGNPEQEAASQIHIELKKLSTLQLMQTEVEITKLGPGKNIRDLILNKISDAIVRSGQIAECYLTGVLGEKLFNIVTSLFTKSPTYSRISYLRKNITPNMVRKYKLEELKENVKCPSVERTRLGLSANLLMLYDYYVDNNLGRQVADRGAQDAGTKGYIASYNKSRQGWREQAEKIKKIATGLYFKIYSHNTNEANQEKKNTIMEALFEINKLIKEIRSSGSCGQHSHFVNELIRIVSNFGKENGFNIKSNELINGEYLFPNSQNMFKHDIDQDNAEDYIHQHIIFHAGRFLSESKNKINSQRWTAYSEKAPLNSAEMNLQQLINDGVVERRKAVEDLKKEGFDKASKFISLSDPDFIHKVATIETSPKYAKNIIDVIINRLEKSMPYTSLFSSGSNVAKGQLKKPFEDCLIYLNEIKKPFKISDEDNVDSMRMCI